MIYRLQVWFVHQIQAMIKSGTFNKAAIDKRPISEILGQSKRLDGLVWF
jgi:hypothetical protein